ncbi:MAG: hypothetical protein ACO33A_12200 [Hyphomonas sp.]
MLRILSVLLTIAGLLVAGIGGAALLEQYAPRAAEAGGGAAAPEPAPEPASAETAPDQSGWAAPDPAPDMATRSAAPEELAKTGSAETGLALAEEDMELNFQMQMEVSGMTAGPAPPDQRMAAMPAAAPAPLSFEERLRSVPVAHEAPATAEYKRPFDVTFAIDATGDTTAADALPGRGVIEEEEANVSDTVEVRLSGANFNIVAASPAAQALSPVTENTWRWSVTALSAGEHDLTFEVFAMDSGPATPLRTFRDTVTVKVSGLNRAIAFADQANPLFVLLGGLGSAIAGLFGAIRFFGKN